LISIGRICLLLVLLTQAFSVSAIEDSTDASAKVYVWRNEVGVLVFSDSPMPGAEEIDITETNIIESSINTSVLDIKPKPIDNNYQIAITQPENEATIRDNTGSVYISGRVKPVFKHGLKIQLYLDGQPYESTQTHSTFALRDIDRGEHQIKMSILDDQGKVIATSSPVTFYMHRTSVNTAN